jgi:hypothetical protein
MNTVIKMGKWTTHITPDEIDIDGFKFRPAEASKITSLLGFAGGMSEMKALPGEIEDPPFKIMFSDYGDLTLVSENKSSFPEFKFADIDNLIVLINDMVKVSIDNHVLRPGARGKTNFNSLPGDGDIV